jgi:hypothetical protein
MLIIVGIAYVGSYVVARATGIVTHYEHVFLAERDGWWRGHEIAPGARRVPSAVLIPLRPLMFAEQVIRGAADRLAG